MERQQFHLIVFGVGSDASDIIQFTTRGKAFEYYNLLCARGGSYDEFMLNCRGGTINDTAKEVTKAVQTETREKDTLRSTVTKRIVDAISNMFLSWLPVPKLTSVDAADRSGNKKLTLVPRQAMRFVGEMKARKLHWSVPDHWMERDDLAIAERIISQAKENLQDLKNCFDKGSLKVLRHV
jgi:hypothetical protein